MMRQGDQLLASHKAVLDAVQGSRGPHRHVQIFFDYLASCAMRLDPDLLAKYKKEAFEYMECIVAEQENRHPDQTAQLPGPQTQAFQFSAGPPPPPQQQRAFHFNQQPLLHQQQQQQQSLPGTSSGITRPADAMQWQPPVDRWPKHVSSNATVWESQEPNWMTTHVPGFQVSPCPPTDQMQTRPPTCTGNVSGRSNTSFNLSGLLDDTSMATPVLQQVGSVPSHEQAPDNGEPTGEK